MKRKVETLRPAMELAANIIVTIGLAVLAWFVVETIDHGRKLVAHREQIQAVEHDLMESRADSREIARAVAEASRELRVEIRELRQELTTFRAVLVKREK